VRLISETPASLPQLLRAVLSGDSLSPKLGAALRYDADMSDRQEERRRPPFGLYDSFLEAERDDVYEHLSVRLKWFGEDCLRASERIREEPRYGLEMIEHLSTTVQQLDKIAGAAQAKEEMMRQAMSWRVAADDLLPSPHPVDALLRGAEETTS
jgi:hypothetical protein